jgi:mono/diheme cytochrome c family protein
MILAIPVPGLTAEVEKGRDLAGRMCANCHMNPGQGEKQGPMGLPGFDAIANRPGQEHEHIVRWLRSRPPMMPDHHLTWDEADALADYIISLRKGE